MKKLTLPMGLIIAGLFFSSCSSKILDFTVMSSKNVSLNIPKDAPKVHACGGRITKAVNKALEGTGVGNDILFDGYVKEYNWIFWTSYKVSGTPAKSSDIKK